MQGASIVQNSHRDPLLFLCDLTEIRTNISSSNRPICTLIAKQVMAKHFSKSYHFKKVTYARLRALATADECLIT